ncbi:MAG: mismatch-specific DNA-glycosylase [Dietzia sp.]
MVHSHDRQVLRDAVGGRRAVSAIPRRPSPLGGRRPTREDLAAFAGLREDGMDDLLPADPGALRLLIVGINPGLWTAAVNAPFARPGNRFWPSLHRAGLTEHLVDASTGLSEADEERVVSAGIGITNFVGRATARADELSREELRAGGVRLAERARRLRPDVVAVVGITAFRTAYSLPRASTGRQDPGSVPGWPAGVELWVVPQPSGLNAHETVDSLADHWRRVWAEVPGRTGPAGRWDGDRSAGG